MGKIYLWILWEKKRKFSPVAACHIVIYLILSRNLEGWYAIWVSLSCAVKVYVILIRHFTQFCLWRTFPPSSAPFPTMLEISHLNLDFIFTGEIDRGRESSEIASNHSRVIILSRDNLLPNTMKFLRLNRFDKSFSKSKSIFGLLFNT